MNMDILLPITRKFLHGTLTKIHQFLSNIDCNVIKGYPFCGSRLHGEYSICQDTNLGTIQSCIHTRQPLRNTDFNLKGTHLNINNISSNYYQIRGFHILASSSDSIIHVGNKVQIHCQTNICDNYQVRRYHNLLSSSSVCTIIINKTLIHQMNIYSNYQTRGFNKSQIHHKHVCDSSNTMKNKLYQLLQMSVRSKSDKIDLSQLPELNEEDLEEYFVRGSGPGGQATNKTSNCVRLLHRPTGLAVKNHETRSLEDNRKRARIQLRHRLDFHLNGENSLTERMKRENSRKKLDKKKKTNEKLAKLKAFKEREHIS